LGGQGGRTDKLENARIAFVYAVSVRVEQLAREMQRLFLDSWR
jgi:hypothetical protein